MADEPAYDPMHLARQWMSQWEKLANEHGAEWLAKPESPQAMQSFASAAVRMQAASNEANQKILTAANLPSRSDVEALGQRLAGIEATLARIESRLGPSDEVSERPAVKRTRKPPA